MSKNEHTSSSGTREDLLDYDGAAEFLGVPTRLVRELWQRRELTGVKVGRRVR